MCECLWSLKHDDVGNWCITYQSKDILIQTKVYLKVFWQAIVVEPFSFRYMRMVTHTYAGITNLCRILYQICCLFYCFGSSLKFKTCCQIWGKFKWRNGRLAGELPLITREKKLSCLHGYIVCYILILCSLMLFSQLPTNILPATNCLFTFKVAL